MRKEKLRSQ